jgi:hypothetical protein
MVLLSTFIFCVQRDYANKAFLHHIRVSIYLDDGIFIFKTYKMCKKYIKIIVELYKKLGFIINFEKLVLEPTQHLIHLGFLLDSVAMTITTCPQQVIKIRQQCYKLLHYPLSVSLRDYAKLPGRLISQQLAIGRKGENRDSLGMQGLGYRCGKVPALLPII